MIQIYLFSEGNRAAVYGIGTYVEQLTGIFRQAEGYRFNIVFTRTQQEEFSIEREGNVTYYYIPDALRDNNAGEKIDKYYRNVWYIMCPFLQENKPDTLVLHLNYYQHVYLADYFKRKFPDGKSCFTIHYMNWGFKIKGNETHLKRILSTDILPETEAVDRDVLEIFGQEKTMFEQVDKLICLSAHTKHTLCESYQIAPGKIVVLYNGAKDEAVALNEEEKVRLKEELQFNRDERIILFTGRLEESKGIDILIEAFKEVVTEFPNCRLVLAGDGLFTEYLSKTREIWNHVLFTGRLEKNELCQLYQIADIGVLPSFHEQCSYTAIEMMMHGIPLIASTSTGLCEMVEEEVTGLHIPIVEYPDRVEINTTLFAQKMVRLLRNPSLCREMGLNARLRYERLYTLNHMKENMAALYAE